MKPVIFEDHPDYKEAVDRITMVLTKPLGETGISPLDPVMMACDVTANIIMLFPSEQRMMVTDIFLKRLGNSLDRMNKKEMN